jgi:hypothetical protein
MEFCGGLIDCFLALWCFDWFILNSMVFITWLNLSFDSFDLISVLWYGDVI